jgi:hypothetical protein
MSIDGRITVDALFHDRSGDRLKVLSLASSTGYTTGKAIVVTGTASTAGRTITYASYRDASGGFALLGNPAHIAFSWSGASLAKLADTDTEQFRVCSKGNVVAVTQFSTATEPTIQVLPSSGTGTFTIIMWGAD